MEKNQGKVISIRLVNILAIVIIISAIVFTINKLKNTEKTGKINDVATVENIHIQEDNSRVDERPSSRSAETSRETLTKEEQKESNKNEVSEENIEEKIEIYQTDNQIDNLENNQSEDTIEETESKIAEKENTEIDELKNEKYISIKELTISEKMDLTERTGLSRDDFIELISRVKQDSSKFFYNNAGLIYDLCEKYSINEIFFCGLISAESGWNIASNHRTTYNYISLMINGKLKQFSSVEDGLEQAAQTLHEKYLTPGGKFYNGKTLAGVKTKFCPSSSTWTSLVYGRMKQIVNSK